MRCERCGIKIDEKNKHAKVIYDVYRNVGLIIDEFEKNPEKDYDKRAIAELTKLVMAAPTRPVEIELCASCWQKLKTWLDNENMDAIGK